MPACATCGHELPSGARFCPNCGSPVATVPTPRETRKTVTVLFADVTGSTALGERLDPESLRALMSRYFSEIKGIIERHGGTVEKFIGDAVMAVFGIPVVHEDDALRGVRAAAEIRDRLAELNAELTASRGLAIRFRTGVNTGEVVAGDPATGQTLVTGDTVNTAARLEQGAPPGEILLGSLTYGLIRDAVHVEPVEPIEAKGKAEPVRAYRLISVNPNAAGHVRRLDAPLVGREREFAALGNAYERVASERTCQLFTLLGSAGVGKSRLVAEFVGPIGDEATVLRGRCLPYGEGITYRPIGEIVRAAARIDETDTADTARAKIRSCLEGQRDADVLTARVACAIGLSTEAAPQEELFWAIRKILEHVAGQRPLVVVFEDIHWAEPTLLDLIEHIAEWSREAPIMLLCTARPELLETRPAWGGGQFNATTVLLEPLGSETTARLMAALPGGSALSDDIQRRIMVIAEGNPLYVEELLGMLVDDDLLVEAADGTWLATERLAEIRIPPSISALLGARLDRLGSDERAVAERASVVGRVFEQAAVTELADDALRPEVSRSLLALVRKELVRPEHSGFASGDAFRFRHVLIRDAAYEALPKLERAVLHERFADWLDRTAGDRIAEYEEVVGYHIESAHRYRTELGEVGELVAALAVRAGTHLAAAGGRAFDRGDMPAAERLMYRAATALPAGSPARLRLLPERGFALFSLGRLAAADALLRDAVAEATAADEPLLAIRADLELALLGIMQAGDPLARQTADAAIPVLQRSGDDLGLAVANLVIASAAWTEGRVGMAVEARGRALAHAAKVGDVRIERRNVFWGAEYYGPAPASSAIEELEISLESATADPLKRAQAFFSLSGLYAMRGRIDEARHAYETVRAILDELGASLWAASTMEMGGVAELIIGDPVRAERWLERSIHELEDLGAMGYLSSVLGLQSVALARQGKPQAALEASDRVARDAQPGDVVVRVHADTGRAIALLGLGDVAGSVDTAKSCVRRVEATDLLASHSDALLALAEALEASGERIEAAQMATRALEVSVAKENLMGERRAAKLLGQL